MNGEVYVNKKERAFFLITIMILNRDIESSWSVKHVNAFFNGFTTYLYLIINSTATNNLNFLWQISHICQEMRSHPECTFQGV